MRADLKRRLEALNGGSLSEAPEITTPSTQFEPPLLTKPQTIREYKAAVSLPSPLETLQTEGKAHTCIQTRLHDAPEWQKLGSDFPRGWQEPVPAPRDLAWLHRHGPERLLFLDIETAGLGDSAVFMVGLMAWDGDHFQIRQLFARSLAEESSMVAETLDSIKECGSVVSFNGKSFDLPFLFRRASTHRLPPCREYSHVDLLIHARRRWHRQFPNCRLQTLEEYLCGRKRVGDVPSRRIPAIYNRYLQDGNLKPLEPVFHHNLLDLIAMAEILLELFRLEDTGEITTPRRKRP